MKPTAVSFAAAFVAILLASCEDYHVVTPQSTMPVRIYRWQSETFDDTGKQKIDHALYAPFLIPLNPEDSVILNGNVIDTRRFQQDSTPFTLDGSINTLIIKKADSIKLENRFTVPTGEVRISNYRNGDTVDFSKDLKVEWKVSEFKGDRVQLILSGKVKNTVEGVVSGESKTSSFYLDAETGTYTFKAAILRNYLHTKCTLAIRRFVDFSIEREPITYDFELGSWHEIMLVVR